MSAIFGIRRYDRAPVPDDIAAMDCALVQRGPDGSRSWKQDSVGIGHRTLRTTPASVRECLPLVDDQSGLVLTADARIDNRRELIASLSLGSEDDEDISDSDVILAAFKRWREAAPEHLVGDFAFAVWDARARTMFCARDPLGVKPFYYSYISDKVFAFASSIHGVLACAGVPRALNETKVADHLLRRFEDTTSTFYRHVARLAPAHSLTMGARSLHTRRYWSLDCERELRLRSDGEYVEAFRERFVEAVRCRIRSSFPVGSTLSGGLDSSSISCAANLLLRQSQRPLRTFAAVFPSLPEDELKRIDERQYVDAVLRSGRFDHTYVYADRSSPLADWQSVSRVFGDACLAPNLYIHWEIYKAAAAKGIRVLLDGLDGDTTVSHGFNHLADLVHTGRWLRFLRESRALSRTCSFNHTWRELAWQLGVRPLVPEAVVRTWRSLRTRHARTCDRPLLSRRLMEQASVNGTSPSERHSGTHARLNHWRALNSPLIPYALEFADAASSSFGIEARYPFFDRRLIEFCLSVPGEQKLRDGWTRSIMRRALDGILPAAVQWRRDKADLSPSFARRLYERDRETLQDVVLSRLGQLEDYIDVDVVRDAFGRWSKEPRRHRQDGLTLFAVATLSFWFDQAAIEGGARLPSFGQKSLDRQTSNAATGKDGRFFAPL